MSWDKVYKGVTQNGIEFRIENSHKDGFVHIVLYNEYYDADILKEIFEFCKGYYILAIEAPQNFSKCCRFFLYTNGKEVKEFDIQSILDMGKLKA